MPPRSTGTGGGRLPGLLACLLTLARLPDPAPARADPAPPPEAAARDRAASVREGYRRYQGVCAHCHGPDGAGSTFASSLVDPLPARDRFVAAVTGGAAGPRGAMRGFAGDPNVAPHLEAIYAYLAGRASGRLGRGRPEAGPVPPGADPALHPHWP